MGAFRSSVLCVKSSFVLNNNINKKIMHFSNSSCHESSLEYSVLNEFEDVLIDEVLLI